MSSKKTSSGTQNKISRREFGALTAGAALLGGSGALTAATTDVAKVAQTAPLIFLAQNCVTGGGVCGSLVSFSGLAAYPGVWVINFLVPNQGAPPGCYDIAVGLNGNVFSNVGPNGGKIFVTYCTK